MHLGTMKFKQRGREEQADPDGTVVSGRWTTIINLLFFFLFFFSFLFSCAVLPPSPTKKKQKQNRSTTTSFLLKTKKQIWPCPWIGTGCISSTTYSTYDSTLFFLHTQSHKHLKNKHVAKWNQRRGDTHTHPGSLWHSGLHPRWEKHDLHGRGSRHAPWNDEVQAKGSRRTGRTRRQRGKIKETISICIFQNQKFKFALGEKKKKNQISRWPASCTLYILSSFMHLSSHPKKSLIIFDFQSLAFFTL